MTSVTSPGRNRGVLLIIVLGALLVGVVLLSGSGSGSPYDLNDAGESGYKALRLTLERLGTRIDQVDAADLDQARFGQDTVAFVPVPDGASARLVARWRQFVEAGGTLVVGDPLPRSGIRTRRSSQGIVAEPVGVCDITNLEDLSSIDPADTPPLVETDDAEHCYGRGGDALVIRQVVGRGAIVTLASPDLFTNGAMRPHDQEVDDPHEPMRDNVVVAQRLLDPDGGTHLAIVTSGLSDLPTGQRRTLTHFMSAGVKTGLCELVAAFILYAWWKARRHGRVVVEHQPVDIAGSELVAAVGNMMSRRRDPGRAAEAVRRDALRRLTDHLGVPRGTDPRLIAAMVAQRTGRDEAGLVGALAAAPVRTDDELIAVTAQLESIQQEIIHGRRPAATAAVPGAAAGAAADPGARAT